MIDFQLHGKTALVTGASRGLGQGMIIGLAKAGADIIGVGISDMTETRERVEALGRKFYPIQQDLSLPNSVEAVLDQAFQYKKRIDILVNNAGIIRRAPAEEFSDQDWEDVLNVNLNIVYKFSSLVGKHMLEHGAGKIINIASMLSFQGGKNVVAYTASKHGVVGLTKSLANEWAGRGVNVNAIAPGYMETDNTEALRQDTARNAFISSRIPAQHWGKPADLEGPVVFLASKASDYVHGHVLCVDGGWLNY
ncbi:2-dehydro-3-deoxy-D-gluconate 5-dehydrogenase KduD [Lederbergia graminis]|uniref:2-dehydro-3-deoxy-D-gluconate 5-dehydrogenase KduD n=1 Tax=Lederbergia graminis TaxID=735518 RepID=A0ABW0LGG2_9BACI